MAKTMDCLLIGHNEMDLADYEQRVRKFGEKSEAYRDLGFSIVEVDGELYTPVDLLNRFRFDSGASFRNGTSLRHSELSPAIAYLGTYLARRGFTFDFINSFQDEKEELAGKLTAGNILTVAITTTLYFTPTPIIEIIQFIRKYNQKVRIIAGGPFVYSQYLTQSPETMNLIYKAIDADFYIIEFQGELTLTRVLNALKNNLQYDAIPNLVYKNNGEYITATEISPENNKLEENMVDWSLFSPQAIGDYVSIRTSISCPFSCGFCSLPQRAGKYRYIDTSVIEENLNLLNRAADIRAIHIIDDTFNVPPERFKEILRMMIKNKYRFTWNSMFRCQYADRETVELMKESNCEGVFLGIESASDQILKNMHKNATVDKFRAGMELLNEYSINTYASFIIGFPGETVETVNETVNFIKETRPTFFRTQPWYCDPVTPIWDEREKYGLNGAGFQWAHKTMDSVTACNLIDGIFLNVKDSIWLTQYRFEFTNLYSLLNKGMPLEQLKNLLRCFNTLVGNKLKPLEMKVNEQEIHEQLKSISRFDMIMDS